jgi:hypothetical protein
MWNTLFLALNFVFLHTLHDTSRENFVSMLHVKMYVQFIYLFINILKYIKYVFQNKGSICS